MNYSATASRPRGFTLIELLVVLMIMGLLVGLVASIARPDERSLLRLEAERLAQLLDLAMDESRFTGTSIAWTADEPGYRFWRMARNGNDNLQTAAQWQEIRDSDLLRARTLPEGMRIAQLQVENTPARGPMRLEFSPNGLVLSFRIDLSIGTEHYTVLANPVGEIRVTPGAGS